MHRNLQQLKLLIIFGFALIGMSSVYWSVLAPSLINRQDNPRRNQWMQRGSILDRHGTVLAESIPTTYNGLYERQYAHPSVIAALGYDRFGSSGLEAEFDAILSGVHTPSRFDLSQNHPEIVGANLQTTLDLNLQVFMAEALAEHQGAAIAVHVPSGEIRAMLSMSTLDPTQLAALALNGNADDGCTPQSQFTEPLSTRYYHSKYSVAAIVRKRRKFRHHYSKHKYCAFLRK